MIDNIHKYTKNMENFMSICGLTTPMRLTMYLKIWSSECLSVSYATLLCRIGDSLQINTILIWTLLRTVNNFLKENIKLHEVYRWQESLKILDSKERSTYCTMILSQVSLTKGLAEILNLKQNKGSSWSKKPQQTHVAEPLTRTLETLAPLMIPHISLMLSKLLQ